MQEAHRKSDGVDEQWEARVQQSLNGHDQRLDDLEGFRIQHLTVCHPDIIKQANNMERRWAIIAGFCLGLGIALGYLGGKLIDLWFTS